MIEDSSKVTIQVVRLPNGSDLELPSYTTDGAAGMDLRAAVQDHQELRPGQRVAVPTGLSIAVPSGYEAQIRPRSGLALKHGLTVINAPGTIDSDYRGEVMVLMANLSQESFFLKRGDRIAQLVIAPVARASWSEVSRLPESVRGAGGFGHTGR